MKLGHRRNYHRRQAPQEKGLLRNYEIFVNLCLTFVWSSLVNTTDDRSCRQTLKTVPTKIEFWARPGPGSDHCSVVPLSIIINIQHNISLCRGTQLGPGNQPAQWRFCSELGSGQPLYLLWNITLNIKLYLVPTTNECSRGIGVTDTFIFCSKMGGGITQWCFLTISHFWGISRENIGRHTYSVVLKFFVERTDFTKSLMSTKKQLNIIVNKKQRTWNFNFLYLFQMQNSIL